MEIPAISGDWHVLLRPEKFGEYVNDHTVFCHNGVWRLIGITGAVGGGPSTERSFISACGSSLSEPMNEGGRVIDTGTLCWAPCVIEHGGLYYMYYGPSPTKMAVSFDTNEWMGYEIKLSAPPLACHRDHYVIKIGENEWLMYASGITPNGLSSICCLRSRDLVSWDFCGYALTSGEAAPLKPAWGAFESPCVVKRGSVYYLFTTYTDCSDETYNNTLVFASENPLHFGEYTGDGSGVAPVTRLSAHAGEVVECEGECFITTCGWLDKPNPNPGCVSAAKLVWSQK